jgi:transcriptional regulator with XRE-family HTH domain
VEKIYTLVGTKHNRSMLFMKNPKTIGQRVIARRKELRMTKVRLAELTGLSDAGITKIENDVTESPKMATITALARALRVTTQWILTGSDGAIDGEGPWPLHATRREIESLSEPYRNLLYTIVTAFVRECGRLGGQGTA